MKEIMAIKVQGMKVLTTRQLAKAYETTEMNIRKNFANNKKQYEKGKHYICLTGEELKEFKTKCKLYTQFKTECKDFTQSKDKTQYFDPVGKNAKEVCLWTEKGALLHAKSINTDKAWAVYDYLVDYYFRTNETVRQQAKPDPSKTPLVVDAPDNPEILNAVQKIKNDLTCMNVLLDTCMRYISEDAYKEHQKMVKEVGTMIMMDMFNLSEIKPKLIEKQY